MSKKTVIFRGGKAYLEKEDRVPCLFVRDVIKHIPLDENQDYDKKELDEVLTKLIKEKDCEDELKWVKRCLKHDIRDFRRTNDVEEFLDESIGYKQVKEVTELDSLLSVMNTVVELEEGTLFKHIWAYIEKDYSVYNMLFNDSLGGFDLNHWIKHARIPREKGDWEIECEKGGYGMDRLQCYWNFHIDQNDYSPFKGEFGGYGTIKQTKWEGKEKVGEEIVPTSYGVDFTPINAMMDLPLELLEEVKIEQIDDWDGKDFHYHKLDPPVNTKKYWTPYLMIEAILWEISFLGPPEAQDKKHDEIMQRMDDFKKGLVETKPFNEFMDDLRDLSVEDNEKELEQGNSDPEDEDG